MQPDWLVPDWPAPATIKAVFTTRAGGESNAPWDSLNLGDHVGDAPQHVASNRATLERAIASRPIFLKQTHGVGVQLLNRQTPDGTLADACVTTQRGLACTVMVADCLPVLLTNTAGTVVAAAHAGWRGLAGIDANGAIGGGGVLEAVVKALFDALEVSNKAASVKNIAQNAPEIVAWLGPCIGPAAFEVGAEVKAMFEASQPGASEFFKFKSQDKYLADLAGLAKARLLALGVTRIYGNDSTAAWCTVASPLRFFSHRRDTVTGRANVGHKGRGGLNTGRMAACVWKC